MRIDHDGPRGGVGSAAQAAATGGCVRFHRQGDRFIAIHLDGRVHNFLALVFGESTTPLRIWAPPRDTGEKRHVDAHNVRTQVLEGVADAAATTGTTLAVTRIHYVESDSPSATIYRDMARVIALRYLAGPDTFDGVDEGRSSSESS